MFTFFNTCNQCLCRDCNGNIRVNNGWNHCGCWNRCCACNGNEYNLTDTTEENANGNFEANYDYGCARICGYNLTGRSFNRGSVCRANGCRRSFCGCND